MMTFSRLSLTTFAALLLTLSFPLLAFASKAMVDSGLIKANAYETEHFRIEFSDLIAKQSDDNDNGLPDVVDTVAQVAEHSYSVEIEDMDYADPMADAEAPLLLILDDNDQYLVPGALGVTSTLSSGLPYIAIDPFMNESYIQVTVAHEYFHAIQFGMDTTFAYTYQGMNFAESTAVWMEDQVYPEVDDFVNYLPDFFNYPDYSVFSVYIPQNTLFQYALNIWPRFLSEYFDNEIIQEWWKAYVSSEVSYASDMRLYDAAKSVVEARGADFAETFRQFSLWNLDPQQYTDGKLFPKVRVLTVSDASEYQAVDSAENPTLFGTNYLYFPNEDKQSRFDFNLLKPAGVSFAVTLVPSTGSRPALGEAKFLILGQDETMDDVLELTGLSGVQGVYAVISPLETDFLSLSDVNFDTPYGYSFLGNFANVAQDYSPLIQAAQGTLDVSAGDPKDSQAPSPVDDSRSGAQPVLQLVEYNADSAYFSWTKLQDSKVVGYELRYGTQKGHYDQKLLTSKATAVSAAVHGLTAGVTYYFQVRGLDAEGNIVGDSSEVLAMTPEAWLFGDVSYLNPHYAAIESLTEKGVFEGYSDGTFKPNVAVNRAELLKILMEGQGLTPDLEGNHGCFADVGEEWFSPYVCYAKAQGWIQGYSDGTFKPAQAVNKVEALKILFKVYGVHLTEGARIVELDYSDLSLEAWYSIYVWKAAKLGLLEEPLGMDFDPTEARTRGQIAEELYRYLVATAQ